MLLRQRAPVSRSRTGALGFRAGPFKGVAAVRGVVTAARLEVYTRRLPDSSGRGQAHISSKRPVSARRALDRLTAGRVRCVYIPVGDQHEAQRHCVFEFPHVGPAGLHAHDPPAETPSPSTHDSSSLSITKTWGNRVGPCPRINPAPMVEDDALLDRARFTGLSSEPSPTRFPPCRVQKRVGAVVAVDSVPVDRVEGQGARFSVLAICDTEIEGAYGGTSACPSSPVRPPCSRGLNRILGSKLSPRISLYVSGMHGCEQQPESE